MKWLTADQHIGETRMKIMQRPFKDEEEMFFEILNNYNAVVDDNDEVYMVGDIFYKEIGDKLLHRLADFKGRKTLIRGNHDVGIEDRKFSKYFENIIPEGGGIDIEIDDIPCHITHYPTQSKQGRFNLVGHIHGAFKYQLNMLNVGVDVHHFRPVPFEDIPFYFKAIKEFYDDDVWCAYNPVNECYKGLRGKKGSYFKGS